MTDIIPIPGFSEPFSSGSHLLAAVLALVGLFYLFKKGRGNTARLSALMLFSVSLIILFSMSGVYHLLDPAYAPRQVLQRLDHAAIWLLIAGTFTPIHTILFRGAWRWAILSFVWTIAISGMVIEAVFFDDIPMWLSLSFYLGLGWVGFLSSWQFQQQYGDRSNRYLWMGGCFYSIGAVLDSISWPVLVPGILGPHEIFHVFIILAAGSHWWFIHHWAHYPIQNQITFDVRVTADNTYRAQAIGDVFRFEAASFDALKIAITESLTKVFCHKLALNRIRLNYQNQAVYIDLSPLIKRN